MWLLLLVLGLAAGSFLNVVSLRYDPNRFLFARPVIGGRSRCIHCGTTLRWFELIPLISFVLQRGKCRRCKARLTLQYPVVELLSGLIFVFVPLRLSSLFYILHSTFYILSALWILALLTLLTAALIDFRLRIIPDECNALLVLAGAGVALLTPVADGAGGSLLHSYGILMFASQNIWLNKLLGFLAGGLGLLALLAVTRGRGMGFGDVKLAAALGALFGWPDIAVLVGMSFVFGAAAGILSVAARRKTLKSALPFGPFLGLAAAFMFFAGFEFVGWYLRVLVG
ncbi:MAG: prepilin peptidase [Candidatus Liptonbacteria bacterium]|nr:prepilin peptidase [Candidatus Liptonbacteria bacterium]